MAIGFSSTLTDKAWEISEHEFVRALSAMGTTRGVANADDARAKFMALTDAEFVAIMRKAFARAIVEVK